MSSAFLQSDMEACQAGRLDSFDLIPYRSLCKEAANMTFFPYEFVLVILITSFLSSCFVRIILASAVRFVKNNSRLRHRFLQIYCVTLPGGSTSLPYLLLFICNKYSKTSISDMAEKKNRVPYSFFEWYLTFLIDILLLMYKSTAYP